MKKKKISYQIPKKQFNLSKTKKYYQIKTFNLQYYNLTTQIKNNNYNINNKQSIYL